MLRSKRKAVIFMQAIEIKKGIYWVGAIDWSMRSFHGYETGRGSSYNAYLILDEKITSVPPLLPSPVRRHRASPPSSTPPRSTSSSRTMSSPITRVPSLR